MRVRNKGFTLIELMIVLAIIAILVAVAYPSYQNSVRKTKRAEGQALLLAAAQMQERHFTRFLKYGTTLITSGEETATDVFVKDTSDGGYYKLKLSGGGAAYALTAEAQGAQANDSCGNLTLDNLGVKDATGSNVNCWGN